MQGMGEIENWTKNGTGKTKTNWNLVVLSYIESATDIEVDKFYTKLYFFSIFWTMFFFHFGFVVGLL